MTGKIVAIVQACMGSTRFPNKLMQPICGTPMVELLLERLSKARHIDRIVLATSIDLQNDPLSRYLRERGYEVYQGSEDDVLDRYYQAAKAVEADVVVRITGDCPLIDPKLVDAVIDRLKEKDADYASNTMPQTYPKGLDTEVFTFKALETSWNRVKDPYFRKHVTPYIRESRHFNRANLVNETNKSAERWIVNEPEDFVVVRKVFEHFNPQRDFSWLEVLALHQERPELFAANRYRSQNEGPHPGTGQKLWSQAKKIIPGGNQLLSKQSEQFLPGQWPSFYKRAKGAEVWDLDNRLYTDMSIMGIGACPLGYADDDVNTAVKSAVDSGSMCTLNCPEEVELAETLIRLHPWADMARYARCGGEAMAIAVRIARTLTKKDTVAFCGYHGWHDWYLSANLADDRNLDGHLIPGLNPAGVPRRLIGTSMPFQYNHPEELHAIAKGHPDGLAAIIMEPVRNDLPDPDFLKAIYETAHDTGAVLIVDEVSAGFRLNTGGAHMFYGIKPDIAVFAKAMSNGYPMAAIIGKDDCMQAAQDSFISSTYWTERVGPVAALATIGKYERCNVPDHLIRAGTQVQECWKHAAASSGLDVDVGGIPPLSHFTITGEMGLKMQTLFTQMMLERSFLAKNLYYAAFAHTHDHIAAYCDAVEEVFDQIAKAARKNQLDKLLKGPVMHTGFKRLI